MKGEILFHVPLTKEVNETMFSDRWAGADIVDPNLTESSPEEEIRCVFDDN